MTTKAQRRYTVQVDSEGLGDFGELNDRLDVSDFCDVLVEVGAEHGLDIRAEAITDSCNGAECDPDEDEIPDAIWDEARERYGAKLEDEISAEKGAETRTRSFRIPESTMDAIRQHAARMSPARPVSATDALIDLVRLGAKEATRDDIGGYLCWCDQALIGYGATPEQAEMMAIDALRRDGIDPVAAMWTTEPCTTAALEYAREGGRPVWSSERDHRGRIIHKHPRE